MSLGRCECRSQPGSPGISWCVRRVQRGLLCPRPHPAVLVYGLPRFSGFHCHHIGYMHMFSYVLSILPNNAEIHVAGVCFFLQSL